ncbi:MAG: hypothetical protein ACI4XE_00130 [Acutalibacteraceae bacterium]
MNHAAVIIVRQHKLSGFHIEVKRRSERKLGFRKAVDDKKLLILVGSYIGENILVGFWLF